MGKKAAQWLMSKIEIIVVEDNAKQFFMFQDGDTWIPKCKYKFQITYKINRRQKDFIFYPAVEKLNVVYYCFFF